MYNEDLSTLIDALEESNQAPQWTAPQPFSSTLPELLTALISYAAAWIYTWIYTAGTAASKGYLFSFALIFTIGGLAYYKNRLKTKEHWIWLGCPSGAKSARPPHGSILPASRWLCCASIKSCLYPKGALQTVLQHPLFVLFHNSPR